jgi:hypothetical protein
MWTVERIVHFERGEFVRDGVSHFGFRQPDGRLYAVDHQRHAAGLVGSDGLLAWTVAARPVEDHIPNVVADLHFPMYVDVLQDGAPIVSNFGDARLWRIDLAQMRADVLVDGRPLGMVDMGNCVVDGEGCLWVNEVRGGRVWRFDRDGRPLRTVDGFGWIYDIRLTAAGEIYVLDSRRFALRAITREGDIRTVAGTGETGYAGDGGDARQATFGSDPSAPFDGPISLAIDEVGNAYVGDRFNHVVRVIEQGTNVISTIAGAGTADGGRPNDPDEADPLRLNLPRISSMDYCAGRLYVPTDLDGEAGDLAILRRG